MTEPIRPYRVSFDSTADFKAMLVEQAKYWHFDDYKHYLIHLVENDKLKILQIQGFLEKGPEFFKNFDIERGE